MSSQVESTLLAEEPKKFAAESLELTVAENQEDADPSLGERAQRSARQQRGANSIPEGPHSGEESESNGAAQPPSEEGNSQAESATSKV